MKYENYIKQIKKDGFYADYVEMGTSNILSNIYINENKPLYYVNF